MQPELRSVADISDFPFETFEEFQEAVREGQALVWVRYDPRSVWMISDPAERVVQVALTGSAFIAGVLFCIAALILHDNWLFLGVPACIIGFLVSTPTLGLFDGGCYAVTLFAAGFVGSAFVHRSLFWVGAAAFACWFLTSAGQGVADITVRDAMVRSEELFLDLYRRRAITKVALKEDGSGGSYFSE